MLYYLIALVVLILDRITKWLIVTKLTLYESRPVIGEFFQITSHRNRGAAFSILQNQRWFFITMTVIVVIGIVWYMQKSIRGRKWLLCTALGLLLGGAVGNFIDRLLTGEVVDFLQFRFQFDWFGRHVDYTYPIFNIADSGIVIGVILIFIDAIFGSRRERKEENPVHEAQGS